METLRTDLPLPAPPVAVANSFRRLTAEQQTLLADLALTVLQNSTGKAADMATILSGRLNELHPDAFRHTMRTLLKCASGSSLDLIGSLVGLTRGTTVHSGGLSREADVSFWERLFRSLQRPELTGGDQLVGVSLRTVLHFYPQATLVQQEAAIAKSIKAMEDEILRTQVDHTLRINWLSLILYSVAQNVVIDIGDPNHPFEQILLWRDGVPEPLVGNYMVQPGERLIVEPSLPAAIDLRPAVLLPQ